MPTPDYVKGYEDAVQALGHEGDYRHVDWSAAFKYLKGEAKKLRSCLSAEASKPIQIRVNKNEKAHLKAMAEQLGMTLSEFLRESAMARAYGVLAKQDERSSDKP